MESNEIYLNQTKSSMQKLLTNKSKIIKKPIKTTETVGSFTDNNRLLNVSHGLYIIALKLGNFKCKIPVQLTKMYRIIL